MIRSLLLALSLAAVGLAGCVDPADEARQPNPGAGCATRYVSMHYEGLDDHARLRDALQAAGYGWRETAAPGGGGEELPTDSPASQEGVAALDPPGGDVVGVVSYMPGSSTVPDANSTRTTILSFEEASPNSDPEQVDTTARHAAGVVNQTFEDAHVVLWVDDFHTADCGSPGGIPPGPRAG